MKIFRGIVICLFSLILFACPGCPEGYRFILIVNKSDRNIICQEHWARRVMPEDTVFVCDRGGTFIFADSLCYFDSENRSGWECDFTEIPYVQFLIIDYETYSKYRFEPCDTIRKYVPVLHRYQLTLEDLIRENWTVIYPPE